VFLLLQLRLQLRLWLRLWLRLRLRLRLHRAAWSRVAADALWQGHALAMPPSAPPQRPVLWSDSQTVVLGRQLEHRVVSKGPGLALGHWNFLSTTSATVIVDDFGQGNANGNLCSNGRLRHG